MYHIVVALAVVAHFAFLCYLVVGGFVALRWRRTIWLHVPAVLWGIAITTAPRLSVDLVGALEPRGSRDAAATTGRLHRPLHHRRALPRQLGRHRAGCDVCADSGVLGAVGWRGWRRGQATHPVERPLSASDEL